MNTIKTIINTLSEESEDAASAGYDSIEWNFTTEGVMTESDVRDGYYGEAFFDKSDANNPGWAYRVTPILDGERQMDRQESGSLADV